MHLGKLALAGMVMLALAGCASATFKPVDKYDTKTAGLRIPERKPIVVLFGNDVSIRWVCNYDRAQALQFSSFLAKHHLIVDFDDCGAIKKLDSDQDSTAVPLKLLDVINAVAQTAFAEGQGTSGTTNSGSLAFQMFDVRFDYDGGIDLVPLVKPGDVLSINTGTGGVGVAANTVPSQGGTGTTTIPGN